MVWKEILKARKAGFPKVIKIDYDYYGFIKQKKGKGSYGKIDKDYRMHSGNYKGRIDKSNTIQIWKEKAINMQDYLISQADFEARHPEIKEGRQKRRELKEKLDRMAPKERDKWKWGD